MASDAIAHRGCLAMLAASFLYLMRCGWSAAEPSCLCRHSSYSVKLPSNQRTWLSPSNASTWVAMRSRNQRSWLMTTAQPGKFSSAVLERPQRVDVEVVRRLVEQQHVAAALQQLGQVHPVALAAGQVADALLLVGALEVEAGDVGAAVDLAVADLQVVDASITGESCR